jgi:hypothetical protein
MLIQKDIDETFAGNNPTINGNLNTDRFDMPLLFRVGISVDMLKGAGDSNLILAVDALHPNDDYECLNIGGEYIFKQMFFIRTGYQSLFGKNNEGGLCAGLGIKSPLMGRTEIMIDYAYMDFGVLNYVQQFTLGIRF